MALLAGVPLLAFIAWIGMCSFGRGDDAAPPAAEAPDGGGSNEQLVKPTQCP